MRFGVPRNRIVFALLVSTPLFAAGCDTSPLIPVVPCKEDATLLGEPCDGPDNDLCSYGVWICDNQVLRCDEANMEKMEICDGIDNDCNPSTADGSDEPTLGHRCDGPDSDLCEEGVIFCAGLDGLICSDATPDELDLCDGIDNDCNPDTTDGKDEPGFGVACDGLGGADACEENVYICEGGPGLVCNDVNSGNIEICDGIDNDCNPNTADGSDEPTLGQQCDGPDSDLCEEGVISCAGFDGLICNDATTGQLDLCDGIDNDCNPDTADGKDEPGFGVACDGLGDADACEEGVYICEGGPGLVCNDANSENLEICDGIDNDCNPNTADGSDELFAPHISVCPLSWDRRPIVEFDPLPAGYTYALYKDGDAVPYATVTTEGQNFHRPANAIAAGGPPPGVSTSISILSCAGTGMQCCAASESVEVSLIEECTAPVAVTANNVMFSEYVINGDGDCPGNDCEAGEAFEITNLSHCPVTLEGTHFGYANAAHTTFRWMDFDGTAVVPPRGVYVAIRNQSASACAYPFFAADDPGLYGLNLSVLQMEPSEELANGWFLNSPGGILRIGTGAYSQTDRINSGDTIALIESYLVSNECTGIGFNAWDACGNIANWSDPTETLSPNQLGRLWKPCNAVVSPNPGICD